MVANRTGEEDKRRWIVLVRWVVEGRAGEGEGGCRRRDR